MSENADGTKYIKEKFSGDRTKALDFFKCLKVMANSEGSMQIIYHVSYGVGLGAGPPAAGAAFQADAAIDAAFIALGVQNSNKARKMYGCCMQMLTGDAELTTQACENIGRLYKTLMMQYGGDNFVTRRRIMYEMMTQETEETSPTDGGLRGHFADKEHKGQIALGNIMNMQEFIATSAVSTMPEPYKSEANRIMARDVAAGVAVAQIYQNVKDETIAMQEADELPGGEDNPAAARIKVKKVIKGSDKAAKAEMNRKKREKCKAARTARVAELKAFRKIQASGGQTYAGQQRAAHGYLPGWSPAAVAVHADAAAGCLWRLRAAAVAAVAEASVLLQAS